MTSYTNNILYDKGIKPFSHFDNLLHTFAMQYKIKVQGDAVVMTDMARECIVLLICTSAL